MKLLLAILAAGLASGQTFTGPALAAICPGTITWDATHDRAMATAPYTSMQYLDFPFTCTIPITTHGVVAVLVAMEEPTKTAAGQRSFVIVVNGQQTTSIDLFSMTGGKFLPYEADLPWFYAEKQVSVTFRPAPGTSAVVSLIKLLPSPTGAAALDPLDPRFMPAIDTDPAHYPANIWTTGAMAKVQQDTGAPGLTKWAVVHAARNEIASFQAHVQAPAAGISSLVATMSDLTNAQTGAKILAASTDVIVYREAYMHLQPFPTATGSTFLWSAWTAPFSAFVPDALIPAVEPYYHQKTNAFPVAVAPGMNQSVWVDVHVPAGFPSGFYAGNLTITTTGLTGSTALAVLPVVYAVWDWSMPSTASLPSLVPIGYSSLFTQTGDGSTYTNSLGSADFGVTLANTDLAAQLLDNRISAGYDSNVYPGAGEFGHDTDPHTSVGSGSFDYAYAPLLNGTPGRVATILPGAKLTSFAVIPLEPSQFNPATFQNFVDHFAARGWPRPVYGLWDEPADDPAVWASLLAKGTQEHGFSTPRTPTYVTSDLDTAQKYKAESAIDRLVLNLSILENYGVGPQQDLARYQAWVAQDPANRSFWGYQACPDSGTCSNGNPGPQAGFPNSAPNYDVDGTPVANRVMEWVTYLHGQTGELYFGTDHCFGPGGDTMNCSVPAAPPNPWVSNYYSGGWGDGTLVYPGGSSASPCAPQCDVGAKTPIWIPSIRLKMIRDGMQDYEYIAALGAAGQKPLADAQVAAVVKDSYHFTADPAVLQAARDAMGAALHKQHGN